MIRLELEIWVLVPALENLLSLPVIYIFFILLNEEAITSSLKSFSLSLSCPEYLMRLEGIQETIFGSPHRKFLQELKTLDKLTSEVQ